MISGDNQDPSGVYSSYYSLRGKFQEKPRLDLNDLVRRRKEEKTNEKRTNLRILSGAAVFVGTIVLAFSFLD